MNDNDFLTLIHDRARLRILYLPHAIQRMSEIESAITTGDVRNVLFQGQIIENYPEDARGHSCLMLGWRSESRPIHIVCAPKDEYLAIITAYAPQEQKWIDGFTRRKQA